MPIYEYRCTACGKDFEKMQKITDSPLQDCPFCQGKVRKLISNTSFHLKGTGWYVTDYAKKSGANSTQEAPKKSTDKSTDSGSTSSDTSASTTTPAKESTS
jgi:putative FmdB family regulatory protein